MWLRKHSDYLREVPADEPPHRCYPPNDSSIMGQFYYPRLSSGAPAGVGTEWACPECRSVWAVRKPSDENVKWEQTFRRVTQG